MAEQAAQVQQPRAERRPVTASGAVARPAVTPRAHTVLTYATPASSAAGHAQPPRPTTTTRSATTQAGPSTSAPRHTARFDPRDGVPQPHHAVIANATVNPHGELSRGIPASQAPVQAVSLAAQANVEPKDKGKAKLDAIPEEDVEPIADAPVLPTGSLVRRPRVKPRRSEDARRPLTSQSELTFSEHERRREACMAILMATLSEG